MSILVPVDELSAFHVGKVIEIAVWDRRPSFPGEIIPSSKSVYAGRLQGFKQEDEDRIFVSLQDLGQFVFAQSKHKIIVRVREKSK